MFRLIVVLAIFLSATQCTSAHAQGRIGKWLRGGGGSMTAPGGSSRSEGAVNHRHSGSHRSYHPSSVFGFSIGIGSYPSYGYPSPGQFNPYRFDSYVYDPYRFGSFEAPDLLKDPYFRERHRYDSHFPGRNRDRYRAPLVLQPAVPMSRYNRP
jgi:hypothetical protein